MKQIFKQHFVVVQLALIASAGLAYAGPNPVAPPSPAVVEEARMLVASMLASERGPYSRIRWYCNDGSVLPPAPYACKDLGGGRQHAEYSNERARLTSLGWNVGTIFAALSWDDLWDAGNRNARLRELALEQYLIDIDDGWILRRARDYRGRVQIEDEETAGQLLLLKLLEDADWLANNYLLAREATRLIPHGGADDRTRDVRRLAVHLAEMDPTFSSLRVEIHTTPSVRSAGRVRRWAAGNDNADARETAEMLAADLDQLYGAAGRSQRLTEHHKALQKRPSTADLAELLNLSSTSTPRERVMQLARYLRNSRTAQETIDILKLRLLLLEVSIDVEAELIVSASEELQKETHTRAELLALGAALVEAAYGTGILSNGEFAATYAALTDAADKAVINLADYVQISGYLRRLPGWATGALRYTFAEALTQYSALDPRAAGFVDDLLRGSVLLPAAEVTRRIARDTEVLTGVSQQFLGQAVTGAFALNPGVAAGRLRIFDSADALAAGVLARDDVVVLPETIAELPPVAGILTLGEGNPLSHVQLLARNFGIPNASIDNALLELLRPLDNQRVLLAVGSRGDVIVAAAASAESVVMELIPATAAGELTVPPPNLSIQAPLPLAALGKELSGKVVGPKAANLGELNRLFPGRVAPAIALPFGIFASHLTSVTPSLRERLIAAYADQSELNADAELIDIRQAIAQLQLEPQLREQLSQMMADHFGAPGSYGVFVRSDTNVEDLPNFTGAGLSETLPNVVGLDAQLRAIPQVWSSVLSDRAIAWRSRLLTNPAEVYASVLLMRSVPSAKSGVLVTTNLAGATPGITVSTAWGVGGAVAGEAAETLVLTDNGDEILVSEAKTPYQRALNPAGGVDWIPAPDGVVLAAAEKRQLRDLAAEVHAKYTPALDDNGQPRPWDIEFGFVNGELTLFQIRPLVEKGQARADRAVRALLHDSVQQLPAPSATVQLTAVPATVLSNEDLQR